MPFELYTGSTTFVRRSITSFFIGGIGESRMALNIDYTTVKKKKKKNGRDSDKLINKSIIGYIAIT